MHSWCFGGRDFAVCVDVLNSVLHQKSDLEHSWQVTAGEQGACLIAGNSVWIFMVTSQNEGYAL